jgi:predicted dehydrogenase
MSGDSPSAAVALAFLGCGGITRRHSLKLRSIGGVARFHASRDLARATEMDRRCSGDGAFGTYEDALADPRVTCAVVATPPASHLEWTLAALAAGKDVVVEKPAFLHSTDADRVAEAAARAGRLVLVAENYHYKPLAVLLRSIVTSGELGAIRYVHVNALKRQETTGWRTDARIAGGGALFEGGIHWVHLMANLGLEVQRVHGRRPGGETGEMERSMLAVFDYVGGAVGTLSHSWEIAAPFGGVRWSAIYGTEGAVHFESNGLLVRQSGRRSRLTAPGLRDFLGFGAMWQDFVAALRTRREPAMTLAHARQALGLIEDAYRSAAT